MHVVADADVRGAQPLDVRAEAREMRAAAAAPLPPRRQTGGTELDRERMRTLLEVFEAEELDGNFSRRWRCDGPSEQRCNRRDGLLDSAWGRPSRPAHQSSNVDATRAPVRPKETPGTSRAGATPFRRCAQHLQCAAQSSALSTTPPPLRIGETRGPAYEIFADDMA
jgi:hypothetical protein